MNASVFSSPLKVRSSTVKPEIGMAPLIDVVFLLLIFFMVTTVFPENQGFTVEKPKSEHAERMEPENMVFIIDQNGGVHVHNEVIFIEDVKRQVEEQMMVAPNTSVILKIDRRASTETLIEVMDACKSGGASRVAIATRPYES